MKHIKLILILSLAFIIMSFNINNKKSENLNYLQTNPFVGTWQYQNGNEIFEVIIWTSSNLKVLGHFRKFTVDANGVFQSEIFNSNKQLGSSNVNWPYVIYSGEYEEDQNIIGGSITDNTLVNTLRGFHRGGFSMTILQESNCIGCPTTAQWKVEKDPGFRSPNEPDFNIPTNIILTKVN